MKEIIGEPVFELFEESNKTLTDAFIDLCMDQNEYFDNYNINENMIHIIRTYDNMRRRKEMTNILYHTKL